MGLVLGQRRGTQPSPNPYPVGAYCTPLDLFIVLSLDSAAITYAHAQTHSTVRGGGGGADSYLVRSCGALEHCSGGWQLCQCCRGPSRYSRPKTVHGSISVDGGMELGVVCLDIVWYNISLAHLWNKRMLHLALDPSGHRWVWWVWCVMNRGLVPGAGCQV